MGTMDGIIDTAPAVHPIPPLVGMLKSDGKLVMLGAPGKPYEVPVLPLIFGKYMLCSVLWSLKT